MKDMAADMLQSPRKQFVLSRINARFGCLSGCGDPREGRVQSPEHVCQVPTEGAGGCSQRARKHDRPAETKAIQRYARATVAIAGMQEKSLPVLPHQATAFARAGEGLDKARNHSVEVLTSAIERNPKLAHEAASAPFRYSKSET